MLEKMLLAGEMLIMLNQIGDSWENPEVDLTLLTLLTFPLPEAFFASHRGNVNNVNNAKSISGFSQESPIDLTLLTLLTFPA